MTGSGTETLLLAVDSEDSTVWEDELFVCEVVELVSEVAVLVCDEVEVLVCDEVEVLVCEVEVLVCDEVVVPQPDRARIAPKATAI